MRKGGYLVNCTAGIVDEAALAEAPRDGTLAGAAMDVFATEPVAADHPLLSLDNFSALPPRRFDRGAARLREPAGRAAGGIRADRSRPARDQRPGH
jgi:D-3-phosphoglycerate dehydrogenase